MNWLELSLTNNDVFCVLCDILTHTKGYHKYTNLHTELCFERRWNSVMVIVRWRYAPNSFFTESTYLSSMEEQILLAWAIDNNFIQPDRHRVWIDVTQLLKEISYEGIH